MITARRPQDRQVCDLPNVVDSRGQRAEYGIDLSAVRHIRRCVSRRRADDQIGLPVAVDIADCQARSELVVERFAPDDHIRWFVNQINHAPGIGATQENVNPSGAIVRWRANYQITNSVSIQIANRYGGTRGAP